MNPFSDTSGEMEPNGLTPEVGEQLINGDTPSPELSELAGVLSELRALPGGEPTPTVGAALGEFVGAGLSQTTSPAGLPEPSIDLTQPSPPMLETSRRKSVFAQIAAFAGTVGGKIVLGGTLAAASVTGAHAAGVIDVPGLPDKEAAVETIDTELADGQVEHQAYLADERERPLALTFTDERTEAAEKVIVEKAEAEAKEKAEAEAEKEAEERAAAEKAELEAKEKAEAEAKKAEEAELEAAQKEQAEKEAEEKAAAEKAELEAKEKAEAEAKKAQEQAAKEDAKTDEEVEEKLTDLEETLNADKAAVREKASTKITKLETEKTELIVKRDDKVDAVNEQYQGWVNDILAQIEQAKSDEEKAELEAYLQTKYERWDAAVEDTKAGFVEPIASIESQLEEIELARDKEIGELIDAFLKDAEAIKAGK